MAGGGGVTPALNLSTADLDAMIPGVRPRIVPSDSYATTSIDSFLAEPDPDNPSLVDGLGIPAVGTTILAGPPKSLKTLLASQLALCVSTLEDGREDGDWMPFLDLPVPCGGVVLFVEEEGGRNPLRRRIERQRVGLGASPSIEFLLFNQIRLDAEASFKRLLATAKYHEPALIVLDPFAFLHSQDENKPAAMAPIMRRLSQLAGEAETSVMVLHHVTKPQADRPAGRLGDRIRGASSITAGVDALFLLDRKGENRATLRGEFRDHEPIEFLLELDPETLLLRRLEVQKLAGKIDPDELLAFVRERVQVTRLHVAEHFGAAKNTARDALEDHPSLDWYDGPRKTRFYKEGTDQ
jgi:hypothetical protein